VIAALRQIESGEEITYDYGRQYSDYFLENGGCRCAACRRKSARLDQFWQPCIRENHNVRGGAMNTKEKVRRVYDNVEAALWATLLAFVVYFIVFTLPNMRKISEQNEIAQVQEMAAEKASSTVATKRNPEAQYAMGTGAGDFVIASL